MKTILPILAFTSVAILYTGCNIEAVRYLFLPPSIVATQNDTPLTVNNPVSIADLNLSLTVQVREVRTASIWQTGNQAYATTIGIPDPIALDTIVDIKIRPMQAYNDGYPALADITSICNFEYQNNSLQSIIEVISIINNHGDNPIDNRALEDIELNITLAQAPSATSQQQFILELITDKNARLADTTDIITLKP